ncbi:MAG: hypothetical protein IPG04_21645 [Polyangiaceae bacterium]|nr:hypothetical protein [Polyangiaceae bacterium]
MRPGSTARHASLLGLALLAGSVSCKTPAQITVYVRGIGFVCSQAEGAAWGEGAEVVAQSSLDELGLEGARATRCIDVFGTDPPRVSYGRVVLLPEGGGAGPVEVLVIGALGSSLGSPGTTSLEACRGFYASADGLRDEGCLANPECARCIFSRRSLGFVDETQLTLQIELTNDCAGVLCAETQTCVSGGCVDATTECPEGTCDLVNDGVGGADGAGGEGGAGGHGGAGGEGGAEGKATCGSSTRRTTRPSRRSRTSPPCATARPCACSWRPVRRSTSTRGASLGTPGRAGRSSGSMRSRGRPPVRTSSSRWGRRA